MALCIPNCIDVPAFHTPTKYDDSDAKIVSIRQHNPYYPVLEHQFAPTDIPQISMPDVCASVHPLDGHVEFYPWANAVDAPVFPTKAPTFKEGKRRVFIGQLPYWVPDNVSSMLYVLRNILGCEVDELSFNSRTTREGRMWTGSAQISCSVLDYEALIEALNLRVLFDETGFWLAHNETEAKILREYAQRYGASSASKTGGRGPNQLVTCLEAKNQNISKDNTFFINDYLGQLQQYSSTQ